MYWSLGVYTVIGVCCLLASIILIRIEPRRLIKGFLLQTAVFYLAISLVLGIYALGGSGIPVMVVGAILLVCLVLTGAALCVDGVITIKREGVSAAHIQPILWGALSIAAAYAWYKYFFAGFVGSQTQVIVSSVLVNIALYTPLALGGAYLYATVYKRMKKPAKCDYIIVLGCAIRRDGSPTPLLKSRLDAAIEQYKLGGGSARLIVSGGQGSGEVVSEAECMAGYLVSCGIPEDRIIREDKSTTTRENLEFSKRLMDDEAMTAVIATSDYHALRAAIIARELGMNAQAVGGRTARYYYPSAFMREYAALILNNKIMIVIYALYVFLQTWIDFSGI